jgi:EAL domain-containing protein (putative c-di-GMP-specific phosphodiesterase class I)/AmiR/NasT family two-component response regulator
MTVQLRVLIADDDPDMRDVLADLLSRDPAMSVVGVAEDADQAVDLAQRHHPDVAVLDVKMPGGGPEAARRVRACSPVTAIVALSAHEDQTSVNEMLAAGAASYLVKGASAREVLDAVRSSVEGGSVLSGTVATRVVTQLATRLEGERRETVHRSEWEGRIRGVLEGTDEIATVFQPLVDLSTGRVKGLEALSRFPSAPVRTPDVWFAEAALVGLGKELEIVAVESALASLPRIPAPVFLAVNVSPELVASKRLRDVLDAVSDGQVVLEITEHAPVHDYPRLRSAIAGLRDRGVGLAVDDAGAGYASLRHILQLTPDIVKLDISITRGVDTEMPQRACASALVTFAREIDATITAEGIETESELDALRQLGVGLGQGYFLGRPAPFTSSSIVPIALPPAGASLRPVTRSRGA